MTTPVTRDVLLRALMQGFQHLVVRHPTPWEVSDGKPNEVEDAGGVTVMILKTAEDAEILIELSDQIDEDIAEFDKRFEEALASNDPDALDRLLSPI